MSNRANLLLHAAFGALALGGFFAAMGASGREDPAPIAGDVPAAVLRFELVDPAGNPIPGRLTFVGEGGPGAELFPNVGARPEELAVRNDVVYSRSGRGAITVPVGTYDIYASRGIEWSLDRTELTFTEGYEYEWTATLVHEVDTTGWISGDYHLHTLTYSGHGDADMEERIISLVGEGLEFAVATDHNHHTDYDPTIEKLGVGERIRGVVGNEVSTPIGHFNAFPLDPRRAVPDPELRDANELFRLIRGEPNRYGVTPVVQLNHPRWQEIDYFGKTGLDPVTGTSAQASYSNDFDSLEIFNENTGWGYYDADSTGRYTGAGIHSVLGDWFHLLNRGHRHAAVGNSDSHTVHQTTGGYPRNFTPSTTDEPSEIDPAEVARALRMKRSFTTIGPFVEFSVDGKPMGSEVAISGSSCELHVRIQAASWIDCDRVKIVWNGDVIDRLVVPDTRDVVRLDARRTLEVRDDGWLVILVEGDDSLAPIVVDQGRPVLPLAVTNPIWIRTEGHDRWRSPWEQALALVRPDGPGLGPAERALTVLAAAQQGRSAPVVWALSPGPRDRRVLLAGARGAEQLADPGLGTVLETAWGRESLDVYGRVSLLRAMKSCGMDVTARLVVLLEKHGSLARRYHADLMPLLAGELVSDWMVIGYFPNPRPDSVLTVPYGPEDDPDVDGRHRGAGGRDVGWLEATASPKGYLDLGVIDGDRERSSNTIAYAQTWLHSPDDREVAYATGTDDGARIWCNTGIVFEDASRHGAHPLQHLGRMKLSKGWNRLLVKVENGGGSFGLYFRVLDPEIASTRWPW